MTTSTGKKALEEKLAKVADAGRARAANQRNSVDAEMRTGPADRQSGAAAPAPRQAPPRTRPVKVTVELQPIEHRKLKRWCSDTADELQLPLVAGAEVLRVLWDLTSNDPALADRVRAELARTGGSRRR